MSSKVGALGRRRKEGETALTYWVTKAKEGEEEVRKKGL